MKLIDRYLLKLLVAPILYCLGGFMMILVISEIFGDVDRIMEARPAWHIIVRFYLSVLAPLLQYLIPGSIMLATLYTLFGLTRNSELVAMRATGISIYRLMLPFLAVGLLFTVVSGFLNEYWVPHAHEWVEEMKRSRFNTEQVETFRSCIYLNQEANRRWQIDKLDPNNPSILHGVEIKQETPEGNRKAIILTERAEYLDGQWWLYGPMVQPFGESDNPIGSPVPLGPSPNSVVEMYKYQETPATFASAIRPWEFLNGREMLQYIRANPDMPERNRKERMYTFHSHLAMPWACLIVILFAIPAGARTARQGVMSAVFVAIAMMAGFYALAQLGLVLGSTGTIPPWMGAWLSNIVFGLIGFFHLLHIR